MQRNSNFSKLSLEGSVIAVVDGWGRTKRRSRQWINEVVDEKVLIVSPRYFSILSSTCYIVLLYIIVMPFSVSSSCPPQNLNNLREFLLVKLINGEKATFQTPTFSKKRERTLEMLIKDLYEEYLHDSKLVRKTRSSADGQWGGGCSTKDNDKVHIGGNWLLNETYLNTPSLSRATSAAILPEHVKPTGVLGSALWRPKSVQAEGGCAPSGICENRTGTEIGSNCTWGCTHKFGFHSA